MKKLLLALILTLGVSAVDAADDKKMAAAKDATDVKKPATEVKLTDADAKDLVVVTVFEEKKYILKKNGTKLEVINHNEESPFFRIKHHGEASPTLEKDVKSTLNEYRTKMSKSSDAAPATLYEFHSDAARRMNEQWQNGAASAGQAAAPIAGVFGQLAGLFL